MTTQPNSQNTQHINAAKKNRWLWLLPLVLFVALAVMLFMRLGKPTDIVPTTALNRPVPVFSLPNLLDPSQTYSTANLPTQPYIINVWASWCPTCKLEHPFLLQLASQGVPLVGVNYKDEQADALAYLNHHQDPFVLNIQDSQGNLALDLGLTGAPESFIVDGQGNIRQHIVGVIDSQNWQARIAPCLQSLMNAKTTQEQTKACQ